MAIRFRVLVIDDQDDTVRRVRHLVLPRHIGAGANALTIDVQTVQVQVIADPQTTGRYRISDKTIHALADACDGPFDLVLADFGYVSDGSVYDALPTDKYGEVELRQLAGKVFTLVDLVEAVRDTIKRRAVGRKKLDHLRGNFIGFGGHYFVYSYRDPRFNQAYFSLSERAEASRGLFERATFRGIVDLRQELLDGSDKDQAAVADVFGFQKAQFLNQLIQREGRDKALRRAESGVHRRLECLAFNRSNRRRFIGEKTKDVVWAASLFAGPMVAACAFFLGTEIFPEWKGAHNEAASTLAWMVATTVIIGVGTFLFWREIVKQATDYKGDDVSVGKSLNGAASLTFLSVVATLIVSGVSTVSLARVFLGDEPIAYANEGFEVGSILVFGMFLAIDIRLARAARVALADPKAEENWLKYERLRVMSVDSIMFIDLPVLFASASVVGSSVWSWAFGHSHSAEQGFHLGFVTGALVAHIIFSQYIFMTLTVRDKWFEFSNS